MTHISHKTSSSPFRIVIDSLLEISTPFPPTLLHRFSDINPQDLQEVKKVWTQVPYERRVFLLEDLEELAESDTLVCFDDLAIFALQDPVPEVRAAAVNLLWECQDKKLVPIFITMMEKDSDEKVRAAAASELGSFMLLGELGELPAPLVKKLETSLFSVYNSSDTDLVRRKALEALGVSSRDELPAMIEKAYQQGGKEWLGTALFAMGRSLDNRWAGNVLAMLDHPDPLIRTEAVRSAGLLELDAARKILLQMIRGKEQEEDIDVRSAAIWSLSQIGGKGVLQTLEKLLEMTDDEDETEYIEAAIENLDFTNELEGFTLMDIETDFKELSSPRVRDASDDEDVEDETLEDWEELEDEVDTNPEDAEDEN